MSYKGSLWNIPGQTWQSFRHPGARKAAKAMVYAQRRQLRSRYNYIPKRMRGYARTGGYYGRYNRRGSGHSHLRPELKFRDDELDANPIPSAGIIDSVTVNIAQGTGESQRIGRKCQIRKYSWRYTLTLNTTTDPSSTHDQVKLFVVWDKQANGAAPGVTAILESAEINSFRNLSNKNRFRILGTRTYTLANPAGAGDGTTNHFGTDIIRGEMNIRCNMPIEFNGPTGVTTEIRSNNILLLLITLDGRIKIESHIRVRFEG